MQPSAPGPKHVSMLGRTKRLFFRGLAALLPTLITLVILIKLVGFVNDYIGKHIGAGIVQSATWLRPQLAQPSDEQITTYIAKKGWPDQVPQDQKDQQVDRARTELHEQILQELAGSWQMAVLGFMLAIVLVCIVGLFLASFVGRRIWRMIEGTVTQLPVVKQIYPYVKQVTDYLFGQRRLEFSQVVAVQYPRKGMWSIAFVTGSPLKALSKTDEERVTLFVPSSPTPFSGYVVTVPRDELIDLHISVDQAARFIVSGGVIKPDTPLISGTYQTGQQDQQQENQHGTAEANQQQKA